ncbi:7059_t:CDS:2, partial [Rhizophagus irregularis]
MGKIFGQFIGGVIIALQLLMIVYLVIIIDKSSLPERGQEISNLTNLPIWINVPCPSLQPEVKRTWLEYVSAFFTGVASLACIQRIRKVNKKNRTNIPTWDTVVDAVNRSITSSKPIDRSMFDIIITVYVTITFFALAVGLVFSVGKLWAIFGIFHNVMEVFIVSALLRMTRVNYVILITLIYSVVSTGAFSLILDFMIPVLFSIVAYQNHVQSDEESQPLIDTNSTNSRLKGLGYLVFAAFVHLIGNISDVVGNDSSISITVFNLSYFVAFPIYAYYVYKDKTDKDNSVKPIQANITVFDFVLLFLWGTTASGISTLIGIKEL